MKAISILGLFIFAATTVSANSHDKKKHHKAATEKMHAKHEKHKKHGANTTDNKMTDTTQDPNAPVQNAPMGQ